MTAYSHFLQKRALEEKKAGNGGSPTSKAAQLVAEWEAMDEDARKPWAALAEESSKRYRVEWANWEEETKEFARKYPSYMAKERHRFDRLSRHSDSDSDDDDDGDDDDDDDDEAGESGGSDEKKEAGGSEGGGSAATAKTNPAKRSANPRIRSKAAAAAKKKDDAEEAAREAKAKELGDVVDYF